jgi:putative oxidoreductase
MKYVFLLGRILFSSVFLVKSLDHFSQKMVNHVTNLGVPLAQILVPVSGILAFLGGISILLGYKAKVGAWFLVVFLVPATFIVHRFWHSTDCFSCMMHEYCFFKNISLLGAALMITYFGSGPLSFDKER